LANKVLQIRYRGHSTLLPSILSSALSGSALLTRNIREPTNQEVKENIMYEDKQIIQEMPTWVLVSLETFHGHMVITIILKIHFRPGELLKYFK
jgi:hypothetical protein